MGSPLVSIIVTFYDYSMYILDTIASLKAQTYKNFEVVLVDDGGPCFAPPSITPELVPFPLTLFRHEETQGLPVARNAGCGQARGELLVFLDSDDTLAPSFLEVTVRKIQESGCDGVYTQVQLFGDSDFLWTPNCTLIELLSGIPGPTTFLVKRKVYDAVGGFKPHLPYNCDHEFWINAIAGGFAFTRLDKPLYRYRKHPDSMSARGRNEWWQGVARLIDEHKDLYTQHFAEILVCKERQYRELEQQYDHIYRQWQEADRKGIELCNRYNELCDSRSFRLFQRLLEGKERLVSALSPNGK